MRELHKLGLLRLRLGARWQVARPEEAGRLFTMFLTHSALALCLLLGHPEPEPQLLSQLQVGAAPPASQSHIVYVHAWEGMYSSRSPPRTGRRRSSQSIPETVGSCSGTSEEATSCTQEVVEAVMAVWASVLKSCLRAPRTSDDVVKGLLVVKEKM